VLMMRLKTLVAMMKNDGDGSGDEDSGDGR